MIDVLNHKPHIPVPKNFKLIPRVTGIITPNTTVKIPVDEKKKYHSWVDEEKTRKTRKTHAEIVSKIVPYDVVDPRRRAEMVARKPYFNLLRDGVWVPKFPFPDIHVNQKNTTFITGPTGKGKTVFCSMYVEEIINDLNLNGIIFDPNDQFINRSMTKYNMDTVTVSPNPIGEYDIFFKVFYDTEKYDGKKQESEMKENPFVEYTYENKTKIIPLFEFSELLAKIVIEERKNVILSLSKTYFKHGRKRDMQMNRTLFTETTNELLNVAKILKDNYVIRIKNRNEFFKWKNAVGSDGEKIIDYFFNEMKIKWVKHAQITKLNKNLIVITYHENTIMIEKNEKHQIEIKIPNRGVILGVCLHDKVYLVKNPYFHLIEEATEYLRKGTSLEASQSEAKQHKQCLNQVKEYMDTGRKFFCVEEIISAPGTSDEHIIRFLLKQGTSYFFAGTIDPQDHQAIQTRILRLPTDPEKMTYYIENVFTYLSDKHYPDGTTKDLPGNFYTIIKGKSLGPISIKSPEESDLLIT